MNSTFIAPCTANYHCNPSKLELYSRDEGKIDFLECNSCGIIWQDTTSATDSAQYEEEYFANHSYNTKRDHRVKKANILLGILEQTKKPGTLLEIGPSMGYGLEAAIKRGWNAEGIDISKHASDYCSSIGIPVYHSTLAEWSTSGKTYDAIQMKHVFEHFENPFETLDYVRKLLNEKGAVQIIVPNSDLSKAHKQKEQHKFYNHKRAGFEHFSYFNQQTLKDILEFSGFDVVQEDYPLLIEDQNKPKQVINRFLRRAQSFTNTNQEIITVAVKR